MVATWIDKGANRSSIHGCQCELNEDCITFTFRPLILALSSPRSTVPTMRVTSLLLFVSAASVVSSQCIQCPADPQCNCASNETCFLQARSCTTCASIQCIASTSSAASSTPSTGCIQCGPTPECNCAADQTCFQEQRTCTTCANVQCVASTSLSSTADSAATPASDSSASQSSQGTGSSATVPALVPRVFGAVGLGLAVAGVLCR
ncbi:hypothetical protein FB45DRAFT_942008 [Roridomyces roridus]|uniref:Membrane anchor Opy2 N-terminal domain-containing protein n=1 Tax=Roridomyces roridus TaxID=1738132 RepID=A0AAD7B5S2_9AGAR|nr:hypothetical protein FB45DRAFT_942008 [Roridomyces roridus]